MKKENIDWSKFTREEKLKMALNACDYNSAIHQMPQINSSITSGAYNLEGWLKKKCERCPARCLMVMFSWGMSTEGSGYWNSKYCLAISKFAKGDEEPVPVDGDEEYKIEVMPKDPVSTRNISKIIAIVTIATAVIIALSSSVSYLIKVLSR